MSSCAQGPDRSVAADYITGLLTSVANIPTRSSLCASVRWVDK